MAILVACSRCGSKLKAPDGAAGKVLSCPSCGNKVAVAGGGSSSQVAPKLPPPIPRTNFRLPLMVTEYIARHLMPGEQLVAVARIHRLVVLVPGAVVLLGVLLCIVTVAEGKGRINPDDASGAGFLFFGLPLVFFGGISFAGQLIRRMTTEYSCTDRRILIKSGWLSTQLREMPLGKVEALNLRQGLFGKLFGYGTVLFKGSGGTRRACRDIEQPFKFYRRVQEQVDAAQQRR
jgi:uncharacterized membrane protein YdbT with pleckstrin-like domain